MFALALLSLAAWFAGASLARRWYPASRSERMLASLLLALGNIVLSIQLLGWSNLLTRLNLGLTSLLFSGAMAAFALRGKGREGIREGLRETLGELRSQLALPFDAIAETLRQRSGIAIGLIAAGGIWLWTSLLSWVAPSGAWDGLWYHEPMVGFALQHRGFGLVEVPRHLEWINGYPRTSEHFMLWLSAFGDRRLIDWTPQLMSPVAVLSVYLLAKRFTGWRLGAMAAAVVLWTIPGVVLQMRSTYIDVTVLAFYLASLHFMTRPKFSLPDLWMTALSLGILGGTKASMIFYLGILALPALASAVGLGRREGALKTGAHLGAAVVFILVLMAPSYLRNWVLHENPIWPLHHEIAGIELDGPEDFGNMQWSLSRNIDELWGVPEPGQDFHDTKRHAFGYSLSFVGLPLFLLAMLAAVGLLLRSPREELRKGVGSLLLLQALGWLTLALSPAYHWARYALPTPAVALVAITWVLHRFGARRLGEGLFVAMVLLNLITLKWAEPAWDVSPELAFELWHGSEEDRATTPTSGNHPPRELAVWRHRNVDEDDVVAMGNRVTFVANLWNEEMTNGVVYVPWRDAEDRRPYPERVLATGARIVVVEGRTPEGRAMSRAEGWERIGQGPYEDTWYRHRSD